VFIACAGVSVVYALMLIASARLKFVRDERAVKIIAEVVGVPLSWFPWLGAAEVAGAFGLVIGLAVPAIGIAAAIGLIVYFVLATSSHLRVGDHDLQAPVIMLVMAIGALVLRIASA
jgi:uncharacterized membrane protein